MTQGNHPASPGAVLPPAGNQSARLPKRTMYVTCHSQIRYDSKTHWLLLGSCLAHLGITLVTKGLLGQLSNPVGAKDPRIPPEQGVPCRLGGGRLLVCTDQLRPMIYHRFPWVPSKVPLDIA